MKTNFRNQFIGKTGTTIRSRRTAIFIQFMEGQRHRRNVRLSIPILRRESCATKRTMLAALREAELNEWLNSGDFLSSMHQPIH